MLRRHATALLAIALGVSCVAHLWRSIATGASAHPGRPEAVVARADAGPTHVARAADAVRAVEGGHLAACNRELAETRASLASVREDLAQRIVPEQRFEQGTREQPMEDRVTPLLKAALGRVPGLTLHDVECRTDICKVNMGGLTRQQTLEAWKTVYRDAEIKKLADGFAMSAGEPVVDVTTGKGGFDVEAYIFTRSAADATADLEAIVTAFRASGTLETCAARARDRGTLEARLAVEPGRAQASLVLGGDLAPSPLGRCLGEGLRAIVQAARIPPTAKYGVVFASFVSPHGA